MIYSFRVLSTCSDPHLPSSFFHHCEPPFFPVLLAFLLPWEHTMTKATSVTMNLCLYWLCRAQNLAFHDPSSYFQTLTFFLFSFLGCSPSHKGDVTNVLFRIKHPTITYSYFWAPSTAMSLCIHRHLLQNEASLITDGSTVCLWYRHKCLQGSSAWCQDSLTTLKTYQTMGFWLCSHNTHIKFRQTNEWKDR